MSPHCPGADKFRSPEEYRDAPNISAAIDEDLADAAMAARTRYGDRFDEAGAMEALARHAFGGDLRDSSGWASAATAGDLPEAWCDAVEESV